MQAHNQDDELEQEPLTASDRQQNGETSTEAGFVLHEEPSPVPWTEQVTIRLVQGSMHLHACISAPAKV